MNKEIINDMQDKFFKARIKENIGYVLKNSKDIISKYYDLNNKEYLECYKVAFYKFKSKYEKRYFKDLENKIYQSMEGSKGTYGIDYVLNNSLDIAKKSSKSDLSKELEKESYMNALKRFKEKYVKEDIRKNNHHTILGLSKFAFFSAIILGIMEGVNSKRK